MSTPYQYPNGVLKNRFEIQDAATLLRAEAAATALRVAQIVLNPLPGRFDLLHLQAIHQFIFQDIYAWAGEIRSIDIGKGAGQFAHHAFIIPQATQLFAKLASEQHLQNLDKAAFIQRAAFYFGEVNALHPFLEGNGRTQRMFFLLLGQQASYHFAWDHITQQEMIAASEASLLKGDNGMLEHLFERVVTSTQP